MTDWRKHDPLCPVRHPLTYPRGYCLCESFSKVNDRARADEREKIELMLVSEGYEAAASLIASMTPDGRADHRGGKSDE